MRKGAVDVVIVGTDRTTASGDVTNKIGTYPLALEPGDEVIVPSFTFIATASMDWR